MMTGEYFLSDKAKENIEREKKREQKEQKKQDKIHEKMKVFEAPKEDLEATAKKEEKAAATKASNTKPDLEELKKKFLKKKQ